MPSGFEFGEIAEFAKELADQPAQMARRIPQALNFAAHATRDEWRAQAKGPSGKHARAYPGSITYDVDKNTIFGVDVFRAEVGPEPGRAQGSLGILEDATGGVKAAPQHAGRKAAVVAEAELEIGLRKAAEDSL